MIFVLCVSEGKKFVPKEQERTVVNDDDEAVETEWDEILTAASEEELVDLAGESCTSTTEEGSGKMPWLNLCGITECVSVVCVTVCVCV